MEAQTPKPKDTPEENPLRNDLKEKDLPDAGPGEDDVHTFLQDFGPQEESPPEGETQGTGPLLGPTSPPWPMSQGLTEEQPHLGPVKTPKKLQQ